MNVDKSKPTQVQNQILLNYFVQIDRKQWNQIQMDQNESDKFWETQQLLYSKRVIKENEKTLHGNYVVLSHLDIAKFK
jgi:hypothetical protein